MILLLCTSFESAQARIHHISMVPAQACTAGPVVMGTCVLALHIIVYVQVYYNNMFTGTVYACAARGKLKSNNFWVCLPYLIPTINFTMEVQ
jgi:hypothetical protein